jgi:putative glutathione S-transferase
LAVVPTLVRFDAVYLGHFKCNRRQLVDYPNLWNYIRELYQHSGIAETVDFTHVKRHYFQSHPSINPTRIVPPGRSSTSWRRSVSSVCLWCVDNRVVA